MQRNSVNGIPPLHSHGFFHSDTTMTKFKTMLNENIGLTKSSDLYDVKDKKVIYNGKPIKDVISFKLLSAAYGYYNEEGDEQYYALFEDNSVHLVSIGSIMTFRFVCDNVAFFNFVYEEGNDSNQEYYHTDRLYLVLLHESVKYYEDNKLEDCSINSKQKRTFNVKNIKLAALNGTILMNNGDVYTFEHPNKFICKSYSGTVDVIRTTEPYGDRLLRLEENGKLFFDKDEIINPIFKKTKRTRRMWNKCMQTFVALSRY